MESTDIRIDQPQRLVRSRTFRDENQPPLVPAGKTLHQRNKSSPALSTQAQQDALTKAVPKRTAFADVSNTARGVNAAKGGIQAEPQTVDEVCKVKISQEGRHGAPLQKPAQRPSSVSTIKGFLNHLGTAQVANSFKNKHTTEAVDGLAPQPYIRRTFSKKATAVLREQAADAQTSAGAHQEHSLEDQEREEHRRVKDRFLQASTASASEAQSITGPAGYKRAADDVLVHGHQSTVIPTQTWSNHIPHMMQSIPVTSSGRQNIVDDSIASSQDARSQPTHVGEIRPGVIRTERHDGNPVEAAHLRQSEQWEAAHFAEPEEDYTTARSLKSKGECTTNPTTIILAPQITTAAEKELDAANHFVQSSQEAMELEEDEAWDTSMVAEYSEEIFGYMRRMEEQMRPNPHYMDNQTEVQWSMRSVLMDWLVQVHHRFSLLPETLFLCVNYIDRFLSCKVVSLGKLQLVGATAIFVAAKYEEINCPSVQEIVYMVDGGYTIDEILKAERFMLSMLQFELGWPGPMSFLRRISKADDYDLETRTLAKYFMEITVMDERFVGCIPSYTAAGAHCLARLMLGKGGWSQKHVHYSGYTYGQLRPLLLTMLTCCDEPVRHHAAIFDKYADKRFKRASTFVQAELNKGFILPAVATRSSIGYSTAHSCSDSFGYQ